VTAVDTSVVVPGLLSWHEQHERCRDALVGSSIPAHALIESYSVMTRLPSPHRVEGSVARTLLQAWFSPEQVIPASSRLQRHIVQRAEALDLEGGAVYDALIALTAASRDELLLTRDARAARTYEALGVRFELLDDRRRG
jgi:predicted nucleic acid-binding protein